MTAPSSVEQAYLTECEREPIHIPGRIQPHGILLALAEPDLRILQISTNCIQLLGMSPEALLEQPLATLLEPEPIAYLRQILARDEIEQNPLYVWTIRPHGATQTFDGLIHRHAGVLILELEIARVQEHGSPDIYRLVKQAITKLQRAPSFAAFCDAAAHETRALVGFDRVMIYRFDSEGHGAVIAEALADGIPAYLGLHYPASDIPKQARELYLRNWLRVIPTANYTPADIVPTLTPGSRTPIDLSYSIMRSVSPIHLEYLANMGVGASMSISLVKDGALWGLIACHHYGPRYISYEVRAACEFLGQAVSLQLASKENDENYAYRMHMHDVSTHLIQRMTYTDPWFDTLIAEHPNMLDVLDATGAALCYEDRITTLGATPSQEDIRILIGWLATQTQTDVYTTNSIGTVFPDFVRCKDVASGVIAAPISREQGEYLLWFRPEVIQTVNWGGEPTKALVRSEDGVRLSPRKSFERWQQLVALHAQPWPAVSIAAATELRNAILTVVLRRATELVRLNADLERSNVELDAFAYIASHDLKEPLRGLHNYAHFLLEDYEQQIDESGRSKLQSMIRLTQRMDTLINSLLHYSRVGRVDLAIQLTDMNELLNEVLDTLATSLVQTQIRVTNTLPVLSCDRVRIREVFQNLIANAIKYNNKAERWIEIGYIAPEPTQFTRLARLHTFYVRDNGIGLQEKHFETIFRIFKRLHGREQFGGGTGAGLTIAKKIIERHGGTIWIESTVGVGSTFFFTMQELI